MSNRYETAGSKKTRSKFSHESLLKHEFFAGRNTEFLDQVMSVLSVEVFKIGDTIVSQGDTGDRMYFLNHGEVEVLIGDVRVTVLKAGSIFGELAVFGSSKRAATVKATDFCDCRSIDQRRFNRILKFFPEDRKFFERVASERGAKMKENLDAALGPECGSSPNNNRRHSAGLTPRLTHDGVSFGEEQPGSWSKTRASIKISTVFRSGTARMSMSSRRGSGIPDTPQAVAPESPGTIKQQSSNGDLLTPRETTSWQRHGGLRYTCEAMCRESSGEVRPRSRGSDAFFMPEGARSSLPDFAFDRLTSEGVDVLGVSFDEQVASASQPSKEVTAGTPARRATTGPLRARIANDSVSDAESCHAPPILASRRMKLPASDADGVSDAKDQAPVRGEEEAVPPTLASPLPPAFIKSKSMPLSSTVDLSSDDRPCAQKSTHEQATVPSEPSASLLGSVGIDKTEDANLGICRTETPDAPDLSFRHPVHEQSLDCSELALPSGTVVLEAGAHPESFDNAPSGAGLSPMPGWPDTMTLRQSDVSAPVTPRVQTLTLTDMNGDAGEGATPRSSRPDCSPKLSERWAFGEQSALRSPLVFEALAQPLTSRAPRTISPLGDNGRLASVYRSLQGHRQDPLLSGAAVLQRGSRSADRCKSSRRGAAMICKSPAAAKHPRIKLNMLELAVHQWNGEMPPLRT